jgi:hypothetical protein
MGRFSNSWKVFKQSLDVLKHDKELLLLPILSGIASIIVIASFVFPMYFTGILETLIAQMDAGEQNAQYLMAGIAFVLYLLLTFVTIYFNAGIVYAAHMRLDGKDPKLSDALKGPSRHLAQIFLWAMFVATVSLLMRIIQQVLRERAGPMVAMLFGWLAGAAWWMAGRRHRGPPRRPCAQALHRPLQAAVGRVAHRRVRIGDRNLHAQPGRNRRGPRWRRRRHADRTVAGGTRLHRGRRPVAALREPYARPGAQRDLQGRTLPLRHQR